MPPTPHAQRLTCLEGGAAAKAISSGGDVAEARAALDKYFSHLPRDGKEPFGSGVAPPPPTDEEVAAAAAAKE